MKTYSAKNYTIFSNQQTNVSGLKQKGRLAHRSLLWKQCVLSATSRDWVVATFCLELVRIKLTEMIALFWKEWMILTKLSLIFLLNAQVCSIFLTELVGIPRVHINKNMAKLQEMNLSTRIGADKGGHWEIVKQQNIDYKQN